MQERINFLEEKNLELMQENTKNKARLETMNLQLKSFDGKQTKNNLSKHFKLIFERIKY